MTQADDLAAAQAALAASQAQKAEYEARASQPNYGYPAGDQYAAQNWQGVMNVINARIESQQALVTNLSAAPAPAPSYDPEYWRQRLQTDRAGAEADLAAMGINPYLRPGNVSMTDQALAMEQKVAGALGFPTQSITQMNLSGAYGQQAAYQGVPWYQWRAARQNQAAVGLEGIEPLYGTWLQGYSPVGSAHDNTYVVNEASTKDYGKPVGYTWSVAPGMAGSFGQVGVTEGVRPVVPGTGIPTASDPLGLNTEIPVGSSYYLTGKASAMASPEGGAIFYGRNNFSDTLDLGRVNQLTFSVFAPGTTPGNPAKYGSSEWYRNEVALREVSAILNDPNRRLPVAPSLEHADTFYQRVGMGEMKITGDLVFGATGEYTIFKTVYNPDTGLPRGYEVAAAGGGRNALQGGGLSLTSFYPTNDARYAAIVKANPDLFSRPGAEMYGGYILPLAMRTYEPPSGDPNSPFYNPGTQYGRFPASTGNLANLVNPEAVNQPRTTLPTVDIPGVVPAGMFDTGGVWQVSRGQDNLLMSTKVVDYMGVSMVGMGIPQATTQPMGSNAVAPVPENPMGLPAPFITRNAPAPAGTKLFGVDIPVLPWYLQNTYFGGISLEMVSELGFGILHIPTAISETLYPKSPDMLANYEATNKSYTRLISGRDAFFGGLVTSGRTENIGGVQTFKYSIENPADMATLSKLTGYNTDIQTKYAELETQRLAVIAQQKKEQTGGIGGLFNDINTAVGMATIYRIMPSAKGWALGVESGAAAGGRDISDPFSQTVILGANFAERAYSYIRERPVDVIADYVFINAVFPAGLSLLDIGVAKAATSGLPVLSTLGRAASTPIAADIGTIVKGVMVGGYVWSEGSYVMAGETPKERAGRAGEATVRFGALTLGAMNPMEFPKAENPYAMRTFFTGERKFSPLQILSMDARAYITSFEVPEGQRAAYRSAPAAFREVRFIEPRPGITETTPAQPFTEPDISLASTIGDARALDVRAAIAEQPHVLLGSTVMEGQRTGLPTGELIRGAPNIHDVDVRVQSPELLKIAGVDVSPFEANYPMVAGRTAPGSNEGIARIGILSRIFGEAIPNEQGYKLPLGEEVKIAGVDYPGVLNQEPYNVQFARKIQAFMQDLVPAEGKAGNVEARELNEQFRIAKDFYDAQSVGKDLIGGNQAAELQAGGKTPIGTPTKATGIFAAWDETVINFDFLPQEDNPIIGAQSGVRFVRDMTLGEIRLNYEAAITEARAGGYTPASLYTANPPAAPYNPGYVRTAAAIITPSAAAIISPALANMFLPLSVTGYVVSSAPVNPSYQQVSRASGGIALKPLPTSRFSPPESSLALDLLPSLSELSPVSPSSPLSGLSPVSAESPLSGLPQPSYRGALDPFFSGLSVISPSPASASKASAPSSLESLMSVGSPGSPSVPSTPFSIRLGSPYTAPSKPSVPSPGIPWSPDIPWLPPVVVPWSGGGGTTGFGLKRGFRFTEKLSFNFPKKLFDLGATPKGSVMKKLPTKGINLPKILFDLGAAPKGSVMKKLPVKRKRSFF